MKILLITENLGSGGAERQLTGLAVLLKQKGYQVRVLTYLEKQFYESFLEENGVDYKLQNKVFNRWTRIYYLYKELKEYKPEVVISFLSAVNISMCLARLFFKTRLIVSERSHTTNFSLRTQIQYNLYRLADFVVPNSYSEADNIVRHYPFLKSKIEVIPNFVDTDMFISSEKIKQNEIVNILCVGRITASKNILKFLEAVRIVLNKGLNFKVTWIGSHYDTYYCNKVANKISELYLQEVFILKNQTNDIVSEYQQADIFCLPSLYEGYPNVICEAMSCELPVICSDVCDNHYIIKPGVNGFLFNPYDEKEIADTIVKILSLSVEEKKIIGIRNKQHVIQQNSKYTFVEHYMKLL